jgi:hypothetical protein
MNISFNDIDPLYNKLLNHGKYKILNTNVFDSSWDVMDLHESKK